LKYSFSAFSLSHETFALGINITIIIIIILSAKNREEAGKQEKKNLLQI